MKEDTTIRLSKKTKALLDAAGRQVGQFGDTYDDIIVKLIHHYNSKKKNGEK
jgi:hypothetical protein